MRTIKKRKQYSIIVNKIMKEEESLKKEKEKETKKKINTKMI